MTNRTLSRFVFMYLGVHRACVKTLRVFVIANNRRSIGQVHSILIDEAGKRNSWIGRNECYRPVAVRGDFAIGDRIDVMIEDAEAFALLVGPVPVR